MDLVTVLLRHSREWVSEIRYDNYRVDGIVIHGKTTYRDLMNVISTQLKINVSLKRIHVKNIVQGNSSALEIHNDMDVKLFLQLMKAEFIFRKYPLCITTSDIVIDSDDVDADDMTIECCDFVEPSELAVAVVSNIESLLIVNVNGEELIRSSSAILIRKFIEFCILGTDNLPRTLLMYLSNSPSATSIYFPTIPCNSRKVNKTTNQNMWYASFNSRQEARPLNSSDFNDLVMNEAEFATPFKANDSILDQIDRELLYHEHNKPVPGGWCLGNNATDKCTL
ncbi:putative leucine-rich repeat receptor-like protein kinase-like [Capsicum annuum]|nr:putative leucine-rich repeat receptor-like protein kinase-like [Capsicum annuum]